MRSGKARSLRRARGPMGNGGRSLLALLALGGLASLELLGMSPLSQTSSEPDRQRASLLPASTPSSASPTPDYSSSPGPTRLASLTPPFNDPASTARLPSEIGTVEQSNGAVADESVQPEDFREAMNLSDWRRVVNLIEALPDTQQDAPDVRYALAVAAQHVGECATVVEALQSLEKDLPLFEDEIRRLRAECQLEVGPFTESIQYFEDLKTAEGWLAAAKGRLNAGQLKQALESAERALKKADRMSRRSRRGALLRARARSLRAQLALDAGRPQTAARDLHWLATQAATQPVAENAAELYERLSGQRLTKTERLSRAAALANEGEVERVELELAHMQDAPGASVDEFEIVAARAWANYHARTNYAEAADLFRKGAEMRGSQRARFLFYAAKARSRAHDDSGAIEDYRKLAKRFPGTGYAERAHFYVARLQYGRAEWADAERSYLDYMDRYRHGRFREQARYELAISRLALRERTDRAAKLLHRLANRTRRTEQEALLTHLEGVALELTEEPKQVRNAIQLYREVIAEFPVSFAALASAARLRKLGEPNAHRARLSATLRTAEVRPNVMVELPPKAAFLSSLGLHTEAEHTLFEQRRDLRKRYSDHRYEALCQLYGSLDRGYRQYSLSYSLRLSDRLGSIPSETNLWAWRCAYPMPYRGVVNEVEDIYKLPKGLVHAVMRQESGFRPDVVSPAGAVGLMQLMPRTARLAAQDILWQPGAPRVPDPEQPTNIRNNVELGGFYLSKLLGMLKDQAPLAIAAYNAGPAAVGRWLEGGDRLPVDIWVARIPYRETRHYVARVMSNWLAYRYLSDPKDLLTVELELVEGTRPDPNAY